MYHMMHASKNFEYSIVIRSVVANLVVRKIDVLKSETCEHYT